jgi:hypothetical protein
MRQSRRVQLSPDDMQNAASGVPYFCCIPEKSPRRNANEKNSLGKPVVQPDIPPPTGRTEGRFKGYFVDPTFG